MTPETLLEMLFEEAGEGANDPDLLVAGSKLLGAGDCNLALFSLLAATLVLPVEIRDNIHEHFAVSAVPGSPGDAAFTLGRMVAARHGASA